jgi:hypothetical protein
MRRQSVLFAVIFSILLLQLADLCNGRATSKKDELETFAKKLRELVDNKDDNEHDNTDSHDDDGDDGDDDHDDDDDDDDPEDRHGKVDSHKSQHETRRPHLTQQQKDRIIELHNKLRKGEGASDMYKFKYNDNLARLAQEWSDRCNWGHRPHDSFRPDDYGFKSVGENIWVWSDNSKVIPDQPIQDWFDEKNNYDYNGPFCFKEPCGHYTAVVWASTREVGCGHTTCPVLNGPGYRNAEYFVCNYGPGGNAYKEKPYKKGEACTECGLGAMFCSDGLCDSSCQSAGQGGGCECKAKCANGQKTNDCKCKCNKGYTGPKCDVVCQDQNDQCGKGWPKQFCHDKNFFQGIMYDEVNKKCPKLCGHCESKRSGLEEEELLLHLMNKMDEEKKK